MVQLKPTITIQEAYDLTGYSSNLSKSIERVTINGCTNDYLTDMISDWAQKTADLIVSDSGSGSKFGKNFYPYFKDPLSGFVDFMTVGMKKSSTEITNYQPDGIFRFNSELINPNLDPEGYSRFAVNQEGGGSSMNFGKNRKTGLSSTEGPMYGGMFVRYDGTLDMCFSVNYGASGSRIKTNETLPVEGAKGILSIQAQLAKVKDGNLVGEIYYPNVTFYLRKISGYNDDLLRPTDRFIIAAEVDHIDDLPIEHKELDYPYLTYDELQNKCHVAVYTMFNSLEPGRKELTFTVVLNRKDAFRTSIVLEDYIKESETGVFGFQSVNLGVGGQAFNAREAKDDPVKGFYAESTKLRTIVYFARNTMLNRLDEFRSRPVSNLEVFDPEAGFGADRNWYKDYDFSGYWYKNKMEPDPDIEPEPGSGKIRIIT